MRESVMPIVAAPDSVDFVEFRDPGGTRVAGVSARSRRGFMGMRRVHIRVVLAAVALTVTLALGMSPDAFAVAGWTVQDTVGPSLTSVAATDADHAWTVGWDYTTRAGGIFATTDGGTTWAAQYSQAAGSIGSIAFADPTHGWAAGHEGTLTTTDGGVTWRLPTSPSGSLTMGAIAAGDATHAWAVGGPSTVVATADGGATWIQRGWPHDPSPYSLRGVCIAAADTIWAVGEHMSVNLTTDGGASWSNQVVGEPMTDYYGVCSPDGNRVWIVGWDGFAKERVLMTTADGGNFWGGGAAPPTGALYGVAFADSNHGWAVGVDGAILGTADGGEHWILQYSAPGVFLRGVAAGDAQHAWAVGEDVQGHGVILSTTNGGFAAVVVSGFSGPGGPAGSQVLISGSGLNGATEVSFNGTPAAEFTVLSDTQISATVPVGATSGPITVIAPGGVGISAASFTVLPTPGVTGLAPRSGPPGTEVTIIGAGFTGAYSVSFNGTPASFTVRSDSRIITRVPTDARSGTVAVFTPVQTLVSQTQFTVTVPRIRALSPSAGRRGSMITITGRGFGSKRGTNKVKFGTTACIKYFAWSATRIKCRVPAKAKFGRLKVTVVTSAVTSNSGSFTVKR